MSLPIYDHTTSSPSTLLPLLSTHLPTSIPLHHRLLQNQTPTSRILATFPPSSSSSPPPPKPWLAAHIDLNKGPSASETQIWLFSTLELPHTTNTNHLLDSETACAQLLSLLRYIHTELVPLLPVSHPNVHEPIKTMYKKEMPYSRSRVLIGSLHVKIKALLDQNAITRCDEVYGKWLFPESCYRNATEQASLLPEGYSFGPITKDEDLAVVVERTHIPRTIQGLRVLPSVGLYYHDQDDSSENGRGRQPVGWAFLGVDGSLSTLHVEEGHRGRNLGVEVSRRLFREEGGGREVDGGWRHADVARGNVQSQRVMEKIGGKLSWDVVWVEVELERMFGTSS